jgi:hypothetical protein
MLTTGGEDGLRMYVASQLGWIEELLILDWE